MCYGMYYEKKDITKDDKGLSEKDDKKEKRAFLLLESLKDQKMDNRQFAQLREEYYRDLGDQN
jgi:hypothetical protein